MRTTAQLRRRARRLRQARRLYRNWPTVERAYNRGTAPPRVAIRGGPTLTGPSANSLRVIVPEVYLDRVYNPPGWNLQPHDLVVDIGANVGAFTVYAARRARRVVAFEPYPPSVDHLRANLHRNDVHNVDVVAAAVGETPGKATLNLDVDDGGHRLGPTVSERSSITVPVVSLPSALEDLGVESVDFAKVDCEGGEDAVLTSMESAGRLDSVKRWAIEYHDQLSGLDHVRIADMLNRAGFVVRVEPGSGPMGYLFAERLDESSESSEREPRSGLGHAN